MKPKTARQTQILEFIKRFIAQNGYSPSLRAIGKEIDLSPSVILTHLENMEDNGLIERMPNKARSIRVVDQLDPRDQTIADLVKALEDICNLHNLFSDESTGMKAIAELAIQKAREVK